jgi:hypothetical protein
VNQLEMINRMANTSFAVALAYCATSAVHRAPTPALQFAVDLAPAVLTWCEPLADSPQGYLGRVGQLLALSDGMALPAESCRR